MFENMEDDEDKSRIVNEVLDGLPKVALNQWGAFVIQHSRQSSLCYIMQWSTPSFSYRARYPSGPSAHAHSSPRPTPSLCLG